MMPVWFVLLLVPGVGRVDDSAGGIPLWLERWVRDCTRVPGARVEWHTGVPSFDGSGVQVGVMEFLHSVLHRWPDCLRRDETYLGGGPEASEQQRDGVAMQFDRSVVITPDAQRWQLRLTDRRAPESGVSLDSHYVMAKEIPDAPWLLGRWLEEHPAEYQASLQEDDVVRVFAPRLRVLADFRRDGESAVAEAVEVVHEGQTVLRYEYMDFRSLSRWPWRVAHGRRMFAPGASGLEYVNTDSLVTAAVLDSIPDEEFRPQRSRMAQSYPGLLDQTGRESPVLPPEPPEAGSVPTAIPPQSAAAATQGSWAVWGLAVISGVAALVAGLIARRRFVAHRRGTF